MTVRVFVATPIAPECVERMRAVDPSRVEVIFEPDLLPPMQFIADHKGAKFTRTAEQQRRWREHLGRAEVLWDFPPNDPDGSGGLAYAPRVRWIQGTSAGIGQRVKMLGLHDSDVICTTARGLHGGPLAEFVFMALLMHVRGLRHLESEQRAHRWNAYCTDELAGKTLAIVGAGHMANKTILLGRAFGMRITAMGRRYAPERAAELGIDRFYPREQLHSMLGEADGLVLTMPHTPDTERMIDAGAIAALKPGAVFVNIARGKVVDEDALIQALRSGHIGFAALDVFDVEPLPESSLLWDMPNVLISPHSQSVVPSDNARLTEIFCHNLRCYLDGRFADMQNVLDKELMY
jgi:phosphoglycerate dehydrogenase-like enzyme